MSLYKEIYHTPYLLDKTILVTGGAGFIGSNIVEYLLHHGAKKVRVLDNLSNGFQKNIDLFRGHPNFEYMHGDIVNYHDCHRACDGVDLISHQAALGSVPRSIENPLATHNANATGFINMLNAARQASVQRFVYASSSSVYGDSIASPKQEEDLGRPLSPYAVSKLTNELYGNIFGLTYGMKTIGLRYFNVFGPRQDPNGPYAAAIPIFMNGLLHQKPVYINGDGNTTRDFTFVANAVQANIRALCAANNDAFTRVYNIAVGKSTSLNELFTMLKTIAGSEQQPVYRDERAGDIKHSLASVELAKKYLGYNPSFDMAEGLRITYHWFEATFGNKKQG